MVCTRLPGADTRHGRNGSHSTCSPKLHMTVWPGYGTSIPTHLELYVPVASGVALQELCFPTDVLLSDSRSSFSFFRLPGVFVRV